VTPAVNRTVSDNGFVPPMAAAEVPQPPPVPATLPADLLHLGLRAICITVL